METLLELQDLDLQIEAYQKREAELPAQKNRFAIQRKRLDVELKARREACRQLAVEQRGCESEIEEKQQHIAKYDQQLFSVKKNEEYQALLHEIELLRKQISIQEERIIAIMVQIEEATARLEEDEKRIEAELQQIGRQCDGIDQELEKTVHAREQLEKAREPLAAQVDEELLARYHRIRESKKGGPAVVPLTGSSCSGCHMAVPPQIVNELLAGDKVHSCAYCGRLLYNAADAEEASTER